MKERESLVGVRSGALSTPGTDEAYPRTVPNRYSPERCPAVIVNLSVTVIQNCRQKWPDIPWCGQAIVLQVEPAAYDRKSSSVR